MARAVDASTIEPVTVAKALWDIAERLRPADRAELEASHGGDPIAIIMEAWEASSRMFLILDRRGYPIAAFGVAPSGVPDLGIVWMLGTQDVEEDEFLSVGRQTRKYIDVLHEDYPILWNKIDARNETSIKWLLWAGFRITDAHADHGLNGELFYEIARIASV